MRLAVAFRNVANALTTDLKRCGLCEDRLYYISAGICAVTALVNTVMNLPVTYDAGILDHLCKH
jgi:hypothetical protein